jgi:hypothetical protein
LVLLIENNKCLFQEVDKERQIEEDAEFQRQIQIAAFHLEEQARDNEESKGNPVSQSLVVTRDEDASVVIEEKVVKQT